MLSRHFGVNRHTVRRALEELSRGGLVRVEQGRGSFVAEDVLDYAVEPRTRFSEWIRRQNKEPSGRILHLTEIAADAHVAQRLHLRAGSHVIMLERLGFRRRPAGQPRRASFSSRPVPRPDGRAAARADASRPRCRAVGVPDYLRQMTRVTARLPTAEEAELLRTATQPPAADNREHQRRSCRHGGRIRHSALSHAARADRLRALRANQCKLFRSPAAACCSDEAGLQPVCGDASGMDWSVPSIACSAGIRFDATGLLVLPGIVDIHGDAFERQLQPRPGVDFPADIALADTESQLLANGITTAFHGVTLSWEPGLRSLTAWRAILAALAARRWTCDMRVHLRWEAYNLEALDTALADIGAGRVHLVAFNDHTPSILRKIEDPVAAAKYSERAGMALDEFRALAVSVGRARDRGSGGSGPHQLRQLALPAFRSPATTITA